MLCLIAAFPPPPQAGSRADIFTGRRNAVRPVSLGGSDSGARCRSRSRVKIKGQGQGPEMRCERPERHGVLTEPQGCVADLLLAAGQYPRRILGDRSTRMSSFTDKEAAQRGKAICPRSHSEEAAGSRLGPRPFAISQSFSVGRRATSLAEAGKALCKSWRTSDIRKYIKHSRKLTLKGQTIRCYQVGILKKWYLYARPPPHNPLCSYKLTVLGRADRQGLPGGGRLPRRLASSRTIPAAKWHRV